MANITVGNLPAQATPLVGGDIIPISRDGTNLNRTTLTTIKTFTDNITFSTVAVAGQSNVVARNSADTLTLVAGTNVTITTNASTDTITINSAAGGGGLSVPNYTADVVTGRTIASTDLQNLLIYNAAANGTFTIPTDATLGLSGLTNNSFEIYQKGNGVPNIVAGSGVTLVVWVGYPTSTLGVTQTVHRVGANTWAVK